MPFDMTKLNQIAMHFDPADFMPELDRISQMGSNFMTMQAPGTEAAPAPGTAGAITQGGTPMQPAPGADFASLINGESGGMPTPGGAAPLPAGFMQGLMKQPQTNVQRAPAAAPQKGKAPQLPVPARPNPVMDLGSILFGKRGF